MKKIFTMSVLLIGVLLMCTACTEGIQDSKADKMSEYYYKQITPLQVEENLNDVGTRMAKLQENIANEPPQEEAQWEVIQEEILTAINDMKAKKEELVNLEIVDEDVKATHQYLVDAYAKLIAGYEILMPTIKEQDEAQAQKAQEELIQAGEFIKVWQEQINE